MDTQALSISYPSFIVVETESHPNSDKNVLCKVFTDNESAINSGDFRYSACGLHGRMQTVTIVVPDHAVLRLPNETNMRTRLLDRILRTQFVEVICDHLNDLVPFGLSPFDCHFQKRNGRVRLDYQMAIHDPGLQAAIDESQWLEFLTGESDIVQFKASVAEIRFDETDIIPVYVNQNQFAVLKLLAQFEPNCFHCELWSNAQLNLLDDGEYTLSRRISAKQLNKSNGEMKIQNYVKTLGLFSLNEPTA